MGIVLGPGLVTSIVLHRLVWAVAIPLATFAVLICVAALPIKRKVSLENYANELERHLLGQDGVGEWGQTSSVRIADDRLERLRVSLPRSFDDLPSEEDRTELKRIIECLRRGEVPEL